MQMNENKTIDARTFPEIWETLTDYQRENLRFAIYINLRVSPQTLWYWRHGKRTPNWANQKELARLTSIVTKKRCSPELLFPKS